MLANMVGRRRQILELHWLKRPKIVPKETRKQIIQNLIIGVYLTILDFLPESLETSNTVLLN